MLSPALCVCGCLQPLGDYLERIHGHWPALESGPHYDIEDRGYKTPCWVWNRATNVWGYSKIKRYSKTGAAHRLFYESYIGAIPLGLDIDHLCRVRLCVNPDHLEAVTCAENIRRGSVAKILPWRIQEIKDRYQAGESQYKIAASFGVRQPAISRIISGERWREA